MNAMLIKLYTFIHYIILSLHSFTALHSTLSRFHHRLPKSFNADAISSIDMGRELLYPSTR